MRRLSVLLGVVLASIGSAAPAAAQTFNSGSTGVDGIFNPTSNITVPPRPNGVFNYTTVNIPAGVTVTYTRNTGNTPVTILASGDVTIAGTIDVSGGNGQLGSGSATLIGSNAGAGGPGGFDGGSGSNGIIGVPGGTGLGPGGGGGGVSSPGPGAGGGFGAPGGSTSVGGGGGTPGVAYGSQELVPILGGSGGGGGASGLGATGGGGGGGGGAIVIGASGTITFSGSILARGGAGGGFNPSTGCSGTGAGGSGGAVRLVATTIVGSNGTINVTGGTPAGLNVSFPCSNGAGAGARGRIRIEAFTNTGPINVLGVTPSLAQPTVAVLPNAPLLQIVSVAGVAAPATPSASFAAPDITLPTTTANPVSVALSGANIPPGTVVSLRAQGQADAVTTASATLAGTLASSSATASLTIPTNQPAVITATASFTVVASAGSGPVFVRGEEVERVLVSATLGGGSQVAYITKSGREILLTGR